MEEWKPITGYEESYQISDLGRVKSLEKTSFIGRRLKEKILKPVLGGKGYYQVTLYKNGIPVNKKIHLLVAYEFLNHKETSSLIVVDHKDNNKSNNKLSNLQIISNRENISKELTNESGYTGVYKNGNKFRAMLTLNGKLKHLGNFNTKEEASNCYKNKIKELKI